MQQRIFLWGGLVVIVGLIVWGIFATGNTPTTNGSVAEINDADHIRGPKTAAVKIIEYSDFQCPACGSYEPIVRKLTEKYGDKIVLVYRHFPLRQLHQNAQLAAQASEAADKQNGSGFWVYHDKLFDNQSSWSSSKDVKSVFVGYAKDQGLDTTQFLTDLNSQAAKDRIETDVRSGTAANISGTPTFFLNGKQIANPRTAEDFFKLIDDILAQQPK